MAYPARCDGMWKLTLYSKPACSLCEEAKGAIEEYSKECGLTLDVVDISQDRKLWEQYQYEIPILLVDGREAARHHIDLKKLRVLHKRWQAGELPLPQHSGLFPVR